MNKKNYILVVPKGVPQPRMEPNCQPWKKIGQRKLQHSRSKHERGGR